MQVRGLNGQREGRESNKEEAVSVGSSPFPSPFLQEDTPSPSCPPPHRRRPPPPLTEPTRSSLPDGMDRKGGGVREGQSTTTFFPPSPPLAGTVITGYGKVKRGCGGGGTLAAVGRGREGGREGAPPRFPAVKSRGGRKESFSSVRAAGRERGREGKVGGREGEEHGQMITSGWG